MKKANLYESENSISIIKDEVIETKIDEKDKQKRKLIEDGRILTK